MWAKGIKIPILYVKINSYLADMSSFLHDYSLLISASKSTVTLFTQDPAQAKLHPMIVTDGSPLPINRSPKVLGDHLDTCLAFHKHCEQVVSRVGKRNNIPKALSSGDRKS